MKIKKNETLWFLRGTPEVRMAFQSMLGKQDVPTAFKYRSYPKQLLLSGLSIGTRTYFPFLFTCVWQLQPIQVSLSATWDVGNKKRLHIVLKRGGSPLGEKNNLLTNGFAKKALLYIRTCRWSQTYYTNRRVWSDSISLVALMINLMVTDFYLEKPHCWRQVEQVLLCLMS